MFKLKLIIIYNKLHIYNIMCMIANFSILNLFVFEFWNFIRTKIETYVTYILYVLYTRFYLDTFFSY
jgi:hypothetical protein